MIRRILVSAFTLSLIGSASAGTVFTAETEAARMTPQKIVAAKVLWSCQETTCTAEFSRKNISVGTCKRVVKEIGKVAEFSNGERALSERQLKSCNTAAKS